jgi:small neutral amino acid transporter SnatA (MarC family)
MARRRAATTWGRVGAAAALTLVCVAFAFGVAAPPERCPDTSVTELEAAAAATAGWIIANQQPDGRWLYEYDRGTDRVLEGYNVIRHAGVASSLYLAAGHDVDGALASADRGLDWALDHLVTRPGWAAVTDSGTISAGTNALLVAGLVERRLVTGDDSYDALMVQLASFLVEQTEPSGALLAYYDLGPDRPRPATYSKYYTGEAYWALARMHRLQPDAGWGEVADRIGAYLATSRDDAEDLWPPIADHWSGYGLGETAAFPDRSPGTPLADDELAYAERQAGLFGIQVRGLAQRFGPWGAAVRGTFEPRGGGYGVLGEGLTGLAAAAALDERLADEAPAIRDRAICNAALALEAQAGAEEAERFASPVRVEGAWFRDDVTRMDDQQHALSALLLTIPLLTAESTGAGGTGPVTWLWVVVVVALVNPLRVAVGVPRAGRTRREITTVAGVGGVIGSTAVLLVGATSGWILDTLHVSTSSMRVAAAALVLVCGLTDLIRRPPGPEPSLAGPRAALVPVAVPLVARPVMLVASLGVVADVGLVPLGAALAIAVVGSIAAVQLPADDDVASGRVLRWGVRLLAALAAAGAVVLLVDGVLDI